MTPRGACPTLTAPMVTGDGLLVRLALDHPALTPTVLAEIAHAAAEHGNGLIDVTARGNIQIRGLTANLLPAFAARIEALDILAPDTPAIVINPLVGADPAIQGNPLQLARDIRIAVAGLALAPKMTVIIDGGGALPLDTQSGDIRLVATEGRWVISLAGDASHATPLATVANDQVLASVQAILEMLASHGEKVRAKMVLDDLGAAPFLAALAGISMGPPPPRHVERIRITDFLSLSVMGVTIPFGQIDSASLIQFSQNAAALGASSIRPAPDRTLLVTGLSPDSIDRLTRTAATLGMITDAADPRLGIAACSGKPACASGHIDTRAIATDIAALALELLDGRQLHVSGCPKGCARPATADLVIIGLPHGIGIVRNARADSVPSAILPDTDPSVLIPRIAAILESKA